MMALTHVLHPLSRTVDVNHSQLTHTQKMPARTHTHTANNHNMNNCEKLAASVCLFPPLSCFGVKLPATSGISLRAARHRVCFPLISSFCLDPSPRASLIPYQIKLALCLLFYFDSVCFCCAMFELVHYLYLICTTANISTSSSSDKDFYSIYYHFNLFGSKWDLHSFHAVVS